MNATRKWWSLAFPPSQDQVENMDMENLAIPSFSWTALLCVRRAPVWDHIYSHEKLGTIGMFPSVCHWQKERSVMFENKVFICLKKKYVCQIFPGKGGRFFFLVTYGCSKEKFCCCWRNGNRVEEKQRGLNKSLQITAETKLGFLKKMVQI